MKNLVTLLVAGVMAVLLTACGEETKKVEVNSTSPAPVEAAAPAADAVDTTAAPTEEVKAPEEPANQ